MYKKPFLFLFTFAWLSLTTTAQHTTTLSNGWWKASLLRNDSASIAFNFLVKDSAGKKILYIRNATERLLVDQVRQQGDSIYITMPFFDASFRAQLLPGGHQLKGLYVRHLADKDVTQPFIATHGSEERFPGTQGNATAKVQGRWSTVFTYGNGQAENAIGEFSQKGNYVQGTFLTPTGDYRFLEGIVTGDSLKLSTFDGSHAFLFTAKIIPGQSLSGTFYAGAGPSSKWKATFTPTAQLSEDEAVAHLKEGQQQLNFAFPNLDSNIISIKDPRFQNKVVIVQISGSWCPNCMDETNFLSKYYKTHQKEGIEIVALFYERTTDFQRSKKSIESFKNRFQVQYPLLITGVTVSDPQRSDKTLPQIDAIKAFPSMLILDKKGNVRKIHAGFEGPGTGIHYEEFQQHFNELIEGLLKES